MITNTQRGSAMVELMILMIAAAYVIHLMIHWNWKFSHDESQWAGEAYDAHLMVQHKVCLEDVTLSSGNRVAILVIKNGKKESICDGL